MSARLPEISIEKSVRYDTIKQKEKMFYLIACRDIDVSKLNVITMYVHAAMFILVLNFDASYQVYILKNQLNVGDDITDVIA